MTHNPSAHRQRDLRLGHTWEIEVGDGLLTIEAELSYDFTPGEKMVMYYPDGSGYPSSPPEEELTAIKVTEISGEDWTIKRPEHPELLGWIEHQLMCAHCSDSSVLERLFFDQYSWPEPDYDDRDD